MEISILIAPAQLLDAYFRWLPFSKNKSTDIKSKIFIYSALWSVASIFLYKVIFASLGINAMTYKFVITLGWLPYFFICLGLLNWKWLQHIFVLGMAVIFALIQHTIASVITLSNFSGEYNVIFYEAAIYLLLFAISLPLCRKYFIKLLPSREFFDLRPQGWYIAIFPLIIVSAHLIRIADDVLIHSELERLSRIYLPLVFFLFYRYILLAAKNFYDLRRLERNKMLLEEKLATLRDYDCLMQSNQKKISVMRHDLRHSYNIIYTENGEIEKALEHIRTQENTLGGGVRIDIHEFCANSCANIKRIS